MKSLKIFFPFLISFLFCTQNLLAQKSDYFLENNIDTIAHKYLIRTNLVTEMFYEPHLDFEYRYAQNRAWAISGYYRPCVNFSIYRFDYLVNNPDFSLQGFGIFADWIHYEAYRNHKEKLRYTTYSFHCGYTRLFEDKYPYGNEHDANLYCLLTRKRQDIVTDLRVSCIIPLKKNHLIVDWFLIAGIRTSYYKTQFYRIDNRNEIEVHTNGFGYPTNGCYIRPDFKTGFEIGFGW
jgi:hypothetical protein